MPVFLSRSVRRWWDALRVSPQKSNLRYRDRHAGLSQREVAEHLEVATATAISAVHVEVAGAQNRLPIA